MHLLDCPQVRHKHIFSITSKAILKNSCINAKSVCCLISPCHDWWHQATSARMLKAVSLFFVSECHNLAALNCSLWQLYLSQIEVKGASSEQCAHFYLLYSLSEDGCNGPSYSFGQLQPSTCKDKNPLSMLCAEDLNSRLLIGSEPSNLKMVVPSKTEAGGVW